jgi:hypothetical protein
VWLHENNSLVRGRYEFINTDKADVFFKVSDEKGTSFSFKTDMNYVSEKMGITLSYQDDGKGPVPGSYSLSGVDAGKLPKEVSVTRINESAGRVYVYTPSGTDSRGFGGAYDITDQLKNTGSNSDNLLELKNIAPIDLKDGNVRIIGMETAGNKLLFTTVENGEVILKPFNLGSNKFSEDINLGHKDFADQKVTSFINCYGQTNDKFISLAFAINGERVAENANRVEAVVYDTDSGKVVLNFTEQLFKNPLQTQVQGIVMKYKNNKLFMLRQFDEVESDNKYSAGGMPSHKVEVTVFGENRTLYDGMIISDVNDDQLFRGDVSVPQGNLYFRQYYALTLN